MKKIMTVIMIMVLMITGCNTSEEKTDNSNNTDNSNFIESNKEMSLELTEAMFESSDFKVMEDRFNKYKERINETTFANYFNVSSRVVATNYYTDAVVQEYTMDRAIVEVSSDSSGSEIVNIYIIYNMVQYFDLGEGNIEESEMFSNSIKGLNRYTFREDRLVGFERVM